MKPGMGKRLRLILLRGRVAQCLRNGMGGCKRWKRTKSTRRFTGGGQGDLALACGQIMLPSMAEQ